MPQAEDSEMYLCVSCKRASLTTACVNCGVHTIPVSPELVTVRRSIRQRRAEVNALRADLDTAQQQLGQLQVKHRKLMADAERDHAAAHPVASVHPQPAVGPPSEPAPPPPPEPEQAPAPPPPESSTRSIQHLLLWMGAILSAAAIIAFTAVAWATFGLMGRAVILFVITAIMMAVPLWLRRRGLTSTAETLAGLATLMVPCDAVVLPLHDTPVQAESIAFATVSRAVLGDGVHTPAVLLLVLLVTLLALAYRLLANFVVPGFIAIGLCLVASVLGFAQTHLAVGSAAMVAASLILGLAAWLFARRATTSSQRASVHVAAAASVVTIQMATVYVSGDHTLVAVAGATAALLVGIRLLLPFHWRIAPTAIAGVVGGISAACVAWLFFYATVAWLSASTPVWNAEGPVPTLRFSGWELTCGVIFTAVAIAAVVARPRRGVVYAAAGAVGVATLPPALALPYQYAAPLLAAFAVLWMVLALSRGGRIPTVTMACGGGFLASYALGLSLGHPSTTCVVLSVLAVPAAIQGAITWAACRARVSGVLTAVAVSTGYGAVLVALHLADLSRGHLAVWASVMAAVLLTIGTLRHAHWHARAADTRWPLFSQPAVSGLAVTVAVAALLAVGAASSPPVPTGEKLTLVVAAFAAVIACVAVLIAIIAPQAASVRSASAAAVVALIAALAAYSTFWYNNSLLWYSVVTIVVGGVVLVLPRHLAGPRLGANVMVVATSTALAIAALSAGFVTLTGGPPALWLSSHTPALLLAMAAAGALLLPQVMRRPFALGLTALAAIAAPQVWQLPWWLGPGLTVGIAAVAAIWAIFASDSLHSCLYGGLSLACGGYSLAAALRTPSPEASQNWFFCAVIGVALLALSVITAAISYHRRTSVGGAAVACGLGLLTLITVLLSLSWRLSLLELALSAMATASFGLLIAGILRAVAAAYLPWASFIVPIMAITAALAGWATPHTALFFAVSGLIGTATAMMMLPNRTAAAIRTGLSLVGVLPALVIALPIPIAAYSMPYLWLGDVWNGSPNTTFGGLAPPSIWAPDPGLVDTSHLLVLALISTTLVVAVLGLASRRAALLAVGVAAALVLPSVPVALNLMWPTLPLVTVAVAIACYAVLSRARLSSGQLVFCTVLAACSAGAATTGALATETVTITVAAVLGVATGSCAIIAVSSKRRAAGWLLCAAAFTGTALAVGFAADLPASLVAFGVLTVSAAFIALRVTGSRVIAGAAGPVEVAGHVIAWCALLMTVSFPLRLAIGLVVYGSLLGLLALLASRKHLLRGAFAYASAGTLAAFGAYWLLLDTADVSIVELYTVPFALATVIAGWMELRRRPQLRSWMAYGAGLSLGLLPSLALVLMSPDEPWRRLGLGAAAVALLLLGSWRRLQAPVVISGILLPVLAIREIAALWTYVPSWLPLAISGVLLLTFGATFEKRRRDLRRLRQTVAAMR